MGFLNVSPLVVVWESEVTDGMVDNFDKNHSCKAEYIQALDRRLTEGLYLEPAPIP